MKEAKLVVKSVDRHGGDLVYQVRAGRKGTGRILWQCRSWDNPRATDQALEWAFAFARREGLALGLPNEEE